jgi:hypothetical protein
VAGTGFVATPTVQIGTKMATNVVWVSDTQLTCVLATGGMTAGAKNVKVTNPDTSNATLTNGFYLGNIVSVTPSSGPNASSCTITNLAANGGFIATPTVTLQKSGQSDIAATNVIWVSATQLTCVFPITGAVAGLWTIRATNPDGTYSLAALFRVLPDVTSVTPSSGTNNASCTITNLAGYGFVATPTVKLQKSGQSDIAATNVIWVSATKLTCIFPITGTATGIWDVKVTNPDTSNGILVGGFTVMVPAVTSVTPSSGPNVSSCTITDLAGNGWFVATPTVTLQKSGQSDIAATSVAWVSATQLTCVFPITGAVLGTWNVKVTNPDATNATLSNGFTVAIININGCDSAAKMTKISRTVNVGIRKSGAVRPTSGQMYPRGQ